MNVCTAVGAIDSKKNYTITFKSEAHKIFYLKYLPECRYQDVYHKALVYCLGIDADTRNHVNSIYDFKTGWRMPGRSVSCSVKRRSFGGMFP